MPRFIRPNLTATASTLLVASLLVGGCNLFQGVDDDDSSKNGDTASAPEDTTQSPQDTSGTDTATFDTRPADVHDGDGARDGTEPPQNVLENPSFEEGPIEEACPPKWNCKSYSSGGGSFSVVGDSHHLEQAAHWSRSGDPTAGAVIKQPISSTAGTRYEVDIAVKASGLSDSSRVFLHVLFDTADESAAREAKFQPSGALDEWTRITGTTPAAPAGTERVRFNLSVGDTIGEVWWDAASLVRISESDVGDTGVDADSGTDGDVGTGITVGGGSAYVAQRQNSGETTYCNASGTVVSTRSELFNAFNTASSGDVVYVESGATIDLSGTDDTVIPSGITLASDRGCGGAEGGLLSTTTHGWNLLDAESDVTIFGVRIEGPRTDWGKISDVGAGVKAMGTGVEIANSELSGFSHYAIQTGYDTKIHHNSIHHNPQEGLGYGVSVVGGHPVIEFNEMNYNRHSVASGGSAGYTARYNIVGPDAISHIFDQHKPGGTTTRIHHNTVRAVQQSDDPKNAPAVTIRGVPSDVATIHHNWIYNPTPPCHSDSNWPGCAILQMHVSSWQSVTFSDNHFGSSTPSSCNIGAPRQGCPAP